MNSKVLCKTLLAVALAAGISAPVYAEPVASSVETPKKKVAKKSTKKRTTNAQATNTTFEGTVNGVNVKVYLRINADWNGNVTGYYKMDGAKYSLKGQFIDDSHIRLTEGYDDGVWTMEIGTGGGMSNPFIWLNGKTNSGGVIDLTGNFN